MQLPESTRALVTHFGEMGSRWGFNRTVGQMYALLIFQDTPLSAEQISETLGISRGNVSMGIKELQSWQLIKVHREPGDRKDYYQTLGSIWDMAKRVFEERCKREIDPTLSLLRAHIMDQNAPNEDDHVSQQVQEMHDLLELVTHWTQSLNTLTPETLRSLMKLGTGVTKVLDFKEKLAGRGA